MAGYSPLNGNGVSLHDEEHPHRDSLADAVPSGDYAPSYHSQSNARGRDFDDIITSGREAHDIKSISNSNTRSGWPLQYRKRTLWILILYVPLLVVPWVLTCVLSIRPFSQPSYISQLGSITPKEVHAIAGWVDAIKVLNSIAAVLTIPAISALLAQAAVVYCQRRKATQSLNVRQVFALADRGWSDISILWGSLGFHKLGTSSRFLWCAALLIFISAIQQPIQSGLVANELATIMTCVDLPYSSCDELHSPVIIGYDPEPRDMTFLPQIILVQEVAAQLATFNEMDFQPRMWIENSYMNSNVEDAFANPAERQTFSWNFPPNGTEPLVDVGHGFFVSNLENGTTTGVLREHAMRFNSSVDCNLIPETSFPETCSGSQPFTASLSIPDLLDIRVCAPGQYGVTPWTTLRDRQDVEEQFFLDVSVNANNTNAIKFNLDHGFALTYENFTIQCSARTTRGYFELGNYRNNYTYGPLVDQWPGPQEMALEWNDYSDYHGIRDIPLRNDSGESLIRWDDSAPSDPFGEWFLNAAGPLMTSVIAMFGNESFFYTAAKSSNTSSPPAMIQLCQPNMLPFFNLGAFSSLDLQQFCEGIVIAEKHDEEYVSSEVLLSDLLWNWVSNFQDVLIANEILSAGMFLSNQAVLTLTSKVSAGSAARSIITARGMEVFKPAVTLAGLVVVSTFIFLQMLGIAFIVWYIYKVPTWTGTLDAMAVVRLSKGIDGIDIPPIGPVSDKVGKRLCNWDGLVGVVDDEIELREANKTTTTSSAELATRPPFRVERGAPGRIHRGLTYGKRKKQRYHWGTESLSV